nr:MAG TPA: hypothetical protein [Caudoviricetes sp.]
MQSNLQSFFCFWLSLFVRICLAVYAAKIR